MDKSSNEANNILTLWRPLASVQLSSKQQAFENGEKNESSTDDIKNEETLKEEDNLKNKDKQDLSRKRSAWKDFGLWKKILVHSPSQIGLSVVFNVGR